MTHILYRWDDVRHACLPGSRLNVVLMTDGYEFSERGCDVRYVNGGRALLVFEGERDIIDQIAAEARPVMEATLGGDDEAIDGSGVS